MLETGTDGDFYFLCSLMHDPVFPLQRRKQYFLYHAYHSTEMFNRNFLVVLMGFGVDQSYADKKLKHRTESVVLTST